MRHEELSVQRRAFSRKGAPAGATGIEITVNNSGVGMETARQRASLER